MTSHSENDLNPRKGDVDGEMQKIAVWLNAYNGTKVRDRMDEIRQDGDHKLWNALYWRINEWFTNWFTRFPLRQSELDINISIKEAALARKCQFLHKMDDKKIGFLPMVRPEDLPRILKKLKELENA